MSRRRVYIAGWGAITALGDTWRSTLPALVRGETAVRPVQSFDVEGFPCTVAAAITERFDASDDRRLPLARRAAAEAFAHSGRPAARPERFGVFLGAESGRAAIATVMALGRAAGGGKTFDHAAFGEKGRVLARAIDPTTVSPAAVASALAREYGAKGPVETVSMACASGLASIAEGLRAIRLGECDLALCGGVGADVDPLMLAGFGKLGALSGRGVSCPFDVRRDGFVVGEGAAMVVLSAEPSPLELAGAGRSLDAYHITKPDPEGDGATRAMLAALADAGCEPAQIGALQAHGTSTPLNDEVEAKAIRKVFGERSTEIPVSSVKGALGHWIAGAGALGFLCALEALDSGAVVPTAGLEEPDPVCALRHVKQHGLQASIRAAQVNAFAFGGANVSAVLRRAA